MIQEKLSMSNLFYKYVVEELLVGYFRKNPPARGNRYYVIIENDEYRKLFLDAIRDKADEIIINNIYDGIGASSLEEEYKTLLLTLGNGVSGLILGSDKDATEDYLTTIRNSVGVAGSPYEDYCVLYVLSDSILSSIITACQDLQSPGEALSVTNIIDSITNRSKFNLIRDYERMYLKKHLEKISEYIEDGTCTLFDFEPALSILEQGSLQSRFNSLDFFEDCSIYDATFNLKNKMMEERVAANHDCYRRVRDIMNSEDDVDKLSLLQKFLDEKLSRKLCNLKDDWSSIDYKDVVESVARKYAEENGLILLRGEDIIKKYLEEE